MIQVRWEYSEKWETFDLSDNIIAIDEYIRNHYEFGLSEGDIVYCKDMESKVITCYEMHATFYAVEVD